MYMSFSLLVRWRYKLASQSHPYPIWRSPSLLNTFDASLSCPALICHLATLYSYLSLAIAPQVCLSCLGFSRFIFCAHTIYTFQTVSVIIPYTRSALCALIPPLSLNSSRSPKLYFFLTPRVFVLAVSTLSDRISV